MKKEKYPEKVMPKEPEIEQEKMNIFYDPAKRQYTVRIPVQFAKAVNLDTKKHKFKFICITPPVGGKDDKTKLKGELVNG